MGILQSLNLLPKKTVDAAPVMPGADPNLAALRSVAQGDLKSVLTGGDRLMALSALLGSVARGSRTTPQEAMAQVQQNAMNRVSTQMQLAQLEAKAQQDAQRRAAVQAFAATLPKDKQEQFLSLAPEEQDKMRSEYVNPTPFQMTQINGQSYMVYRSGPPVKLDLPENVKGTWRSVDYNGDGVAEDVFINEFTGQPILNKEGQPLIMKLGMTPAQKDDSARGWANVGIARERLARGGDGEGGGKSPDGKVRTVVYEVPGAAKPAFAQGQVLPGGFVRVTSGPHAGKIMRQAKSGGGFMVAPGVPLGNPVP